MSQPPPMDPHRHGWFLGGEETVGRPQNPSQQPVGAYFLPSFRKSVAQTTMNPRDFPRQKAGRQVKKKRMPMVAPKMPKFGASGQARVLACRLPKSSFPALFVASKANKASGKKLR